ncbi:hypothetical protein B0H14DRAFT_3467895 [Mycena olivaceomarginata]|nr:hypothetical protein B0H14DRAFT_3467895 [Mycena olivaceomarginata]
MAFKKDPSKNPKLANLIGEGTSAGIAIAALLERLRLEVQYDSAKDKSDEAKEQIKKNNAGGEAICQASMKTLRTRPASLLATARRYHGHQILFYSHACF